MVRTNYIEEARDSLDAAWEYIEDFKLRCGRFFDSNPCGIITEEELQGNSKIIRHRFAVFRVIPAGLRRPVSACIGELRPILDHLVYGLSQVVGKPPSCDIKFPTCLAEIPADNGRTFEGWKRQYGSVLSKFPTGAVDLIRSLQPFNPDKRGQSGTSHILYILNKLAVQHKHKTSLHIAGVNSAGISGGHICMTGPSKIGANQPLEHNSVIMELTVPTSDSAQNYKVEARTYIAFDKEGPAPSAPVYEFLIYVHDFIRDEVIAKFEPFFSK